MVVRPQWFCGCVVEVVLLLCGRSGSVFVYSRWATVLQEGLFHTSVHRLFTLVCHPFHTSVATLACSVHTSVGTLVCRRRVKGPTGLHGGVQVCAVRGCGCAEFGRSMVAPNPKNCEYATTPRLPVVKTRMYEGTQRY